MSTKTVTGTKKNLVVKKGVKLIVKNGGKTISATVNTGGSEVLLNKGNAVQSIVSSGGKMIVSKGGVASNTWVSSGGRLLVSSGGIARGGGLFFDGTYGRYYSYCIASGGSNIVSNGGKTIGLTVSGGGAQQMISKGGMASKSLIMSSAAQKVMSGGKALGTIVSGGAVQHVKKDATAQNTKLVYGSQIISKGGTARKTSLNGGHQFVLSGGKAVTVTLSGDGYVTVAKGAVVSGLTISYGDATVYGKLYGAVVRGGGDSWQRSFLSIDDSSDGHSGFATGVKVYSEGYVDVEPGGTITSSIIFSGGTMNGNGGTFRNITLKKGGTLDLFTSYYNNSIVTSLTLDGGVTYGTAYTASYNRTIVKSGASMVTGVSYDSNTQVKNGGTMVVNGYVTTTPTVSSGGRLILNSGTVSGAKILKGGRFFISGGIASATTLAAGASLRITSGTAQSAAVASGTVMTVTSGGAANAVTLKKGATLTIAGTLNGESKAAGGSILKGGKATLSGSLLLQAGADTAGLKLVVASGGTLNLAGSGHSFASLNISSGAKVEMSISGRAAAGTNWLLSAGNAATHSGAFSIATHAAQQTGRYEIGKNIRLASGAGVALRVGSSTVATAAYAKSRKAASSGVWGGMDYTVYSSGGGMVMDVAAHAGAMIVDVNDSAPSANGGTANSDIFYGGKGDDTFTGNGGRDVAVYDAGTSWGHDTIAATSGTMTIMLAGVASGSVKSYINNTTNVMTIYRNKNETISVAGWSSDRYNIVYGANVSAFLDYAKKVAGTGGDPADNEVADARSSVWKAAGLAST